MSMLPSLSLGAPNVAGIAHAQTTSPLISLLTALGQLPQMQYEKKVREADLKSQQMQLQTQQIQNDALKRQTATQGWQFLGQMLQSNPDFAKNPNVIAKAQEYAQTLGVPNPMNADGSLNADVWKEPWTQAIAKDRGILDRVLALPPGPQRDAVLNAFSGVPMELRTSKQSISPKDQAALTRAQAYSIHEADWKQLTTARLNLTAQRDDAMNKKDFASVQQIENRIQTETMNAQASMMRANAALQNASTRANEYELKYKSFERNPSIQTQRLAVESARAIESERSSLNNQINGIQRDLQTAWSNGVDASVIDQMNAQVQQLKQVRDKLNNQAVQANTVLNMNLGTAGTVKAATRAQHVDVRDAGGNKSSAPFDVPKGYHYGGKDAKGDFIIRDADGKKFYKQ